MFSCCKIKKNKKKNSDVIIIDWSQSLSQCGGDEDFLHELLRETHKEIKNPISEIDHFSDNSIREYSHMVKGVSQNMFCEQLGDTSSRLERMIIEGNNRKEINNCIKELKQNIISFENLLKEKQII